MNDLGKRIDFHTHTLLSDGALIPSELIRQAEMVGYQAIGITDHVDASNLEETIDKMLRLLSKQTFPIPVIPGVELTYVHPDNIPAIAGEARKLGAKVIIVHGETTAFDEPVYPGTNRVSLGLKGFVDILAHPGKITKEEAELAAKNGIYLELSAKKAHGTNNAHIAAIARKAGAKLLVNTDAHNAEQLLNQEGAYALARNVGLSDSEAREAIIDNPLALLARLGFRQ